MARRAPASSSPRVAPRLDWTDKPCQTAWTSPASVLADVAAGSCPVQALRTDRQGWSTLRRLSEPLYTELAALNASPPPDTLARQAERIDLIIGETNQGTEPYGTSFEHVLQRLTRQPLTPQRPTRPQIQVLPGQGHLAHITGPALLARGLDALA